MSDYKVGWLNLVFEDAHHVIIYQQLYDLKSDDLNLPSIAVGERVELQHETTAIIGAVSDVKHVVQADGGGNVRHSLKVTCKDSSFR